MEKVTILKKLGLVKFSGVVGVTHRENVYVANRKSLLLWGLYVLFFIVAFIPSIVIGAVYGTYECLKNNYSWFFEYEIKEKINKNDERKDICEDCTFKDTSCPGGMWCTADKF